MDLISRKAAIDAIRAWAEQTVIRKSHGFEPKGKAIVLDMIGVVTEQPSVPAVPLDKLCEYLNSVIYPCIVCKESPGPQCNAKRKGCWERVLTKWMEEQDEAD